MDFKTAADFESDSWIAKSFELFNNSAEIEFPHKKLDYDDFCLRFIASGDGVEKITVLAQENGEIIGFANGCTVAGKDIGYITFVIVKKEYRRRRIGEALLLALENALKKAAEITKFQIIFFNPINLEWIVPNTQRHDHPNAPGIDVASEAYIFFKNMNYRDVVFQNSFYLPLDKFEMPQKIKERIEALPEKKLSICFADKSVHTGFDEMLDNLGNDLWKKEIGEAIENGRPVLIAESEGRAVGFTGPLAVQPSGRGYFAGIGVHSDFRSFGLGKCLFFSLCENLKQAGAKYMTLFTGENNPAREMYTAAGFKIVKTWSDMEKVIK